MLEIIAHLKISTPSKSNQYYFQLMYYILEVLQNCVIDLLSALKVKVLIPVENFQAKKEILHKTKKQEA